MERFSEGPPDAELIARVLAGDRHHAFATLVRRHQSRLRGQLRRLTGGDEALADDLAQEIFLKAYQALPSFGGRAAFSSWLYRIAYHHFVSEMRRDVRRGRSESSGERSGVDREQQPGPSSARVDLESALRTLPWEERTALVCTYGRDLSHEEAAQMLDWPLGTLKSRVASAKEKLRARLSGWQEEAMRHA